MDPHPPPTPSNIPQGHRGLGWGEREKTAAGAEHAMPSLAREGSTPSCVAARRAVLGPGTGSTLHHGWSPASVDDHMASEGA